LDLDLEGAGHVTQVFAECLETPGQPRLHLEQWRNPKPGGVLVVMPGLGDHCGRYAHLARRLAGEAGLVDVIGFDPRGHGRSEGRRGVVRAYDELIDDLVRVVRWASERLPTLPTFLLGHSNGGLAVLAALLDRRVEAAGVILTAPALALKVRVPWWKLTAGRVLEWVAPWATLGGRLPSEHLSRDPAMVAARSADPLVHCRLSPPLFFGLRKTGARVFAGASQIRAPTLIIVGERDPVIDTLSTLQFASRLGSSDVTVEVVAEGVHEPLHDLGWAERIETIAGWLRQRLGTRPDDANQPPGSWPLNRGRTEA
jgi:alpha-beta hydrolase superfamily lysophospholipase